MGGMEVNASACHVNPRWAPRFRQTARRHIGQDARRRQPTGTGADKASRRPCDPHLVRVRKPQVQLHLA